MNVQRIDVATPSRSYAVTLGSGTLDGISTLLDELKLPARRFVVSSPLVWRLHGAQFARAEKLTFEATPVLAFGSVPRR